MESVNLNIKSLIFDKTIIKIFYIYFYIEKVK